MLPNMRLFSTFAVLLVTVLSGTAQNQVDPTFNPVLTPAGNVKAVAVASDGKVVFTGGFTHVNGVPRNGIARVNADGSTDMTFDPAGGFSASPEDLFIQTDGKILAAGPFFSYNGANVTGIVRINADGSRDTTFNPVLSNYPFTMWLQTDGKILVGGNFISVNATPKNAIARLNADGSLDTSFATTVGPPFDVPGTPATINSLCQLANGKIVIGGHFFSLNTWNKRNLAQLNPDGTTDVPFSPLDVPVVRSVSPQPDGRSLVIFNNSWIDFRLPTGNYESEFRHGTFVSSTSDTQVEAAFVQGDRSVMVAGRFDTVGPHTSRNFTRLSANGVMDIQYINNGANGRTRAIVAYGADKVIVAGDFTSIDSTNRSGLARMRTNSTIFRTAFDFNGDGRGDFTAYRPDSNVWYELFSGGSSYEATVFGIPGDIPVPADYDGDGKTDEAIFRPSNGQWWYNSSVTGPTFLRQYGSAGDKPIPGDFDGDSKADIVLYRPTNSTFYRYGSLVGERPPNTFGLPGDIPVQAIGYYGTQIMAVFRPSIGYWLLGETPQSSASAFHFGQAGDIPFVADFSGGGRGDYAIFRPSTGVWYILNSNLSGYTITQWGLPGDKPVPADYDGDGRADIAVYRPSDGIWYVLGSTSGFMGVRWGISTDIPAPNALIP